MTQITGRTKLTGLLGRPVSHSKSPLIHNEGFRQLGLDYVYLAFDVGTENLKTVTDGFRHMGVRGFNLTMPNKTAMCQYCDTLSPAAKIIGAVNTVVNDDGHFTGYTTDGIGFMRALASAGVETIGKKMTIFGTGGAATSIYVQAALDGAAEITIFNRRGVSFDHTAEKIHLLKEYSNCKISLYDYTDETILRHEMAESDIIVNGTPVGMSPDTDASIISDASLFLPKHFVADVIYDPSETKFLKMARQAGCRTQNGLPMLLYQGAEAFKLWTGSDMPVQMIKEKLF